MAVTPEQALASSPAAALSSDDASTADRLENMIDARLTGIVDESGASPPGWSGTFLTMEFGADLPPRVAAELVRRYARAGWAVEFTGVPAQTKGPRGEIVVGGVRLTLRPKWERAAERLPHAADADRAYVDPRLYSGHVDGHVGGGR